MMKTIMIAFVHSQRRFRVLYYHDAEYSTLAAAVLLVVCNELMLYEEVKLKRRCNGMQCTAPHSV